jgi:hypothetical protein
MGLQLQELDHDMISAAEMLGSADPEEVAEGTRILEEMLAISESTQAALGVKADRVLIVAERLTQQAAARKAIVQRLSALVKADEAKAARLGEYVIKVLTTLAPNEKSFTLGTHNLTSRMSEVVELSEEIEEEPETYLDSALLRTTVTYAPDKAAIKTALKLGTIIKGANLRSKRNWTIK